MNTIPLKTSFYRFLRAVGLYALVACIAWLIENLSAFNIPPAYIPIAGALLQAADKYVRERWYKPVRPAS